MLIELSMLFDLLTWIFSNNPIKNGSTVSGLKNLQVSIASLRRIQNLIQIIDEWLLNAGVHCPVGKRKVCFFLKNVLVPHAYVHLRHSLVSSRPCINPVIERGLTSCALFSAPAGLWPLLYFVPCRTHYQLKKLPTNYPASWIKSKEEMGVIWSPKKS